MSEWFRSKSITAKIDAYSYGGHVTGDHLLQDVH